ncbi:hypothetical protein AB0O91_28155 [Kitasatospora sp. NPDC089797]|uniref:hypothetical protein n=1 Tax=Kitasatospora sp. NPDC089797 TaxID=3155298 RepID=UPI00343B74C6
MRFTSARKRVVVAAIAAVAAAGIGLGTAGSAQAQAQAQEGNHPFGHGPCAATEIIQLGDGNHDYMAIDPTATDGNCLFGVFDRNAWKWIYGATTSGAESPYYYDGPGNSLEACLIDQSNSNTWACGPIN